MQNFVYSIPTEIYFGKGQIKNLVNIIKNHGSRVLIVYGGGSIKKIGLYDTITTMFNENNIKYTELSGVEPNPKLNSVKKGIELCRQFNADIVLSVGGGSTIDCGKVIAAGVAYDGDPWDLVTDPKKIKDVLPIVSVLTLAATGSEMDMLAVISNMETNDKIGVGNVNMRPVASILDPEYTYTVSKYQTAAGTADIMSHIIEAYFSNSEGYMQDRMAEGLLKTCIEFGVKAIEKPDDYEARANLMWTSSWAINGFLALGKPGPWSCHAIEHELSAYYDITHGVGLAIITPHWMKRVLNDSHLEKFVQYGVNVWGIDSSLDKYEIANKSIEKTREYFNSMGIPSTLREVGIGEEKFDIMAEKASKKLTNSYSPLNKEDVLNIYKASL
nr:iron-containing alcohol dehydrogenase [Sedimentibacter sp.]